MKMKYVDILLEQLRVAKGKGIYLYSEDGWFDQWIDR